MITEHIIPRVTSDTLSNTSRYDAHVDRRNQLRVRFYEAAMYVTDISQAMKAGGTCTRYTVRCESDRDFLCQNIIHRYGSLRLVWQLLDGMRWAPGRFGGYDGIRFEWEGKTFGVYRHEDKGVRTFTRLHLDRIKRLKSAPKKWTVPHAIRAIVNGQYQDLRVDGYYSDDYALDASTNYGKGQIERPIEFARKIYESPSGWWVGGGSERVSINCHHFDMNSFRLDLEASSAKSEVPSC